MNTTRPRLRPPGPWSLALAGSAVLVAALAGCATASDASAPASDSATGPSAAELIAEQAERGGPTAAPTEWVSSEYALCAEFPPAGQTPAGDLEGWWNGAPANPDGSIIRDPDEWPDARMRDHPRLAVVGVDSAEVYSTWDRITCGPDPTYVPTRTDEWPADVDSVVLDMDTGEVLATGRRGG